MYFNTINYIFCFSAKLREIYLLVANMSPRSLCYSMSGTLLDLLKEIAFTLSFLFFFYLSSLLKKVDERRKSMSKV